MIIDTIKIDFNNYIRNNTLYINNLNKYNMLTHKSKKPSKIAF